MSSNLARRGCYNCDDQGRVSVKGAEKCGECLALIENCLCGSRKDTFNEFEVLICPVCKGQKDLFK